jgi:hypothetical protein
VIYPEGTETLLPPVAYAPALKLSVEEEKLILRLRQLRRAGNGELLLIDPQKNEIRVVGGIERLAKA